jgi:predicted cupin superfamily sugar epimerase
MLLAASDHHQIFLTRQIYFGWWGYLTSKEYWLVGCLVVPGLDRWLQAIYI